jgi:hypothetical protein
VVVGSPQFSLAAPEPADDELLPCDHGDWAQGKICSNAALLTRGFHPSTSLGPFAKTCQAVHMLGKVLRHRTARKKAIDGTQLLEEALGLHRALSALDSTFITPDLAAKPDTDGANVKESMKNQPGLAVCIIARFILYNQYA